MESSRYLQAARELAPKLNAAIEQFDSGEDTSGIQAFGQKIRDQLKQADLSYREQIHPELVLTHPENRHTEMLSPINSWSLLDNISFKGFNWDETNLALAGEIPPGAVGDEWRREND